MQPILLSLSLLASAAVGVVATEDLKIDVTYQVECDRRTQKGDRIDVHYMGTLQSNGQKFDASKLIRFAFTGTAKALFLDPETPLTYITSPGYDRGTPFSFTLGGGMVIKGFVILTPFVCFRIIANIDCYRWDEGLVDMCIGEKRTLTVPPSYGYGQRAIGPIPAGSTLVFETELVGIEGVPKPEKIVPKPETQGSSDDSAASEAGEKVAEKIVDAAKGAAEVVKTIIADTDDTQEHNEL